MATPGSLAISSLHYTQVTKIVCIISNGYPGTRLKLIRVPGRHFTTFLTPLVNYNYVPPQKGRIIYRSPRLELTYMATLPEGVRQTVQVQTVQCDL